MTQLSRASYARRSMPSSTVNPAGITKAVIVAVTASIVVAGCSGGSSSSSSSSSSGSSSGSSSTGSSSAAVGALLTIAEQQGPNSLNPAQVDQNPDFIVPSYDPLIYLTSSGKLEPALATKWTESSDNKSLTLTIRSGVKFTDGTAVTPAAVVASLKYAAAASGTNAIYFKGATFATSGAADVKVTVPTPNPLLPTLLSQQFGVGDIISPAGLADPKKLATSSQGAGPYIYDAGNSVVGDHYTYTANPNYYDKSRQHFKKLVIRVIANQQTAVNAASTGQLDVFVGDYTVAAQAKAARLQNISQPSLWLGLLFFDRAGAVAKPLANLKVRQAINYAIDRKSIANAVLGDASAADAQLFAPQGDGYLSSSANAYAYDPAKAKQLLSEAGYPKGFTFNTITASFGGFSTVAKAVAGQLAKVGITMNVDTESQAPAWIGKILSKKFAAGVQGVGTYPPYIECQNILLPTAGGILNPFASGNSELTSLCTQLAAAKTDQQDAVGQKISKWVIDNAWFAPVAYSSRVYFARSTIQGVAISVTTGLANPLEYSLKG